MRKMVDILKRETNPFVYPEEKTLKDYVLVMGPPIIVAIGLLVMFLTSVS